MGSLAQPIHRPTEAVASLASPPPCLPRRRRRPLPSSPAPRLSWFRLWVCQCPLDRLRTGVLSSYQRAPETDSERSSGACWLVTFLFYGDTTDLKDAPHLGRSRRQDCYSRLPNVACSRCRNIQMLAGKQHLAYRGRSWRIAVIAEIAGCSDTKKHVSATNVLQFSATTLHALAYLAIAGTAPACVVICKRRYENAPELHWTALATASLKRSCLKRS